MSEWIGSYLLGNGTTSNEQDGKSEEKLSEKDQAAFVDEVRNKRMALLEAVEREAKGGLPISKTEIPVIREKPTDKLKTNYFETRISEAVKSVLRVTLSLNDKESYVYLETYVKELEEQGLPPPYIITLDNVGEIFYSRLAYLPEEMVSIPRQPSTILEYILGCYTRSFCDRLEHCDRKGAFNIAMTKILNAIIELCVNYSATTLIEPEMFPHYEPSGNIDYLVAELCRSNGISHAYIRDLAAVLEEQHQSEEIFGIVFTKLTSGLLQLRPGSILSGFYSYLYAISQLCQVKKIAVYFSRMNGFLLHSGSPRNGQRLQQTTALGIMLAFATDNPDPEIARMLSNPTKRTRVDVDNSLNLLRSKLTILQDVVFQIMNYLLKASPESKHKVLEWLALAMEVNAERSKQNPNMMISSSHGMFLNLTSILLQLCHPFLNKESKKIKLIEAKFLFSDTKIFPKDETKLLNSGETDESKIQAESSNLSQLVASTASQVHESLPISIEQPLSSESFNFITQCFFLTARSVHLGPISVIQQYTKMMHQLGYLQNRIDSDPQAQMHFDRILSVKFLLDAKLLQQCFLTDLVQFAALSAEFVTTLCVPNIETLEMLPLPSPPPPVLFQLPQHFVEDILDILVFAGRYQPSVLEMVSLDNLMSFMTMFLASPEYLYNPHLRAKISSVMFEIFLPADEMMEEKAGTGISQGSHLLLSNALAQQHLAPCLLGLYGEVEQTGFYEKLEHRYNIACLLKFLWKHEQHKGAFHKISQDQQTFVRFANGLMNHINGLLTDALTNLPEIKVLEEEMTDASQWAQYDAATQEQKQSLLREKERTVTSSLQLANETIHMLSYLTSEIQEPFLSIELIDRLASMLNSVLRKLAGPRGCELKVANPDAYKFRPKVMLKEIIETILHFASYEEFQHAVAINGFYSEQIYNKTTSILHRIKILPPDSIEKFEKFGKVISSLTLETQDFDEIPEEFLDPVMCTLMKDPVILPTSGYIVDRATITQHLLNDPTDPFTRAPLALNNLQTHDELREKIQQWMKEHKK